MQVFDTPTPGDLGRNNDVTPIAQVIYPPRPDGSFALEQAMVTELPEFRFDDVPPTAYVRAIFTANLIDTFSLHQPTWGTWFGGYDLSSGPIESTPLQAVQIPAGTGRSLRMPLNALRRLRVTLTLPSGVAPLDDGEGPAWALAVRTETPREDERVQGGATLPCARVGAGSSPTLEGARRIGTFYLAAGVDDYNLGGTRPPGGLVSFNFNAGTYTLPAATRVEVAPNAFTVDHTVPLNFRLPLESGGAPAPFSCATVDAGR